MKNTRALFALFLLALSWPYAALAQGITDAEAQRLQGVFQKLLTERQQTIDADTKRPRILELDGTVSVEQADTHYAITLPRMSIKYPDGGHVDIGLIALNASPHDKPGQLKMTMALPTPISGFEADGTETLRISFGAQQSAGIWHEGLETFIKLDAVYKDININMSKDSAKIVIPEFRANYNLDKTPSGRWSGPIQFDFKDIAMENAKNNSKIKIAALSIQSTLDEFLGEELKPGAHTTPSLKAADGAELNISLRGFNATKGAGTQTPETLSLADASVDFSFDDALTGSIDAQFGLNFNDLSTTNVPADLVGLLPKNGKLALTHHNIPLDQISAVIDNSSGGEIKMLGLALMLKIPAILAQSGSYIELSNSTIDNDNYDINMTSMVRADIAAANSFTAEGTLRFAGLDKVLSLAQVAGTNLNSSTYAKPMRDLARWLERIKPVGRIQTDDKWGFIHIFDLKMTQTGQFTINGQNSRFIFDDSAPQAAPTPPVEAPVSSGL